MRLDAVLARLIGASVERGIDHGIETSEEPRAAVAAILRELPGQQGAELFFIRRAEQTGDPWSGHVAFPGGRRDPDDASLLETAIRETREEVGISLDTSDVVARLPDVPAFTRSKKGRLVVSVFVFAVRADVAVVPNVEVAATLWVPLATLMAGVGQSTFELEYDGRKYDLPFLYLEPGKPGKPGQPGEPGQHRLWGMTYGMLIALLDAVK
ncbi:MAG: CoA pyrophosphatase [Labilithrix sp.]|nr:CoA pyrophosphatase [Labilithrix sp.]MCW5817997.1 CoA pyrophosphatase [Labilithrix sp.]